MYNSKERRSGDERTRASRNDRVGAVEAESGRGFTAREFRYERAVKRKKLQRVCFGLRAQYKRKDGATFSPSLRVPSASLGRSLFNPFSLSSFHVPRQEVVSTSRLLEKCSRQETISNSSERLRGLRCSLSRPFLFFCYKFPPEGRRDVPSHPRCCSQLRLAFAIFEERLGASQGV